MNTALKEFKEYLEYEKKYPLNTVNSYISDINFFLNYLSSINKNINQICQECGFSSSWFIERFKKKYQLTPKQYQKSKNLYFLSKNTH